MESIKAICSDIIKAANDVIDDDICFPDKHIALIRSALDDGLYIIKDYHKMKKFNHMVDLIYSHVRQVEEYKGHIPNNLESKEIEHNIQSLESIMELFSNLY